MRQQPLKTSRRAFLQATAGLGAVVSVHLLMADCVPEFHDPASRAQVAYIEAVVHKHLGRSSQVHGASIRLFARRFTQQYGVVDYKAMYGGIVGEYRLSRLFARSLYASQA